jgi:hypothetical protein
MCVAVQIFSNDQQLAFELQGSSFKLVVGTLQVRHSLLAAAAAALRALWHSTWMLAVLCMSKQCAVMKWRRVALEMQPMQHEPTQQGPNA